MQAGGILWGRCPPKGSQNITLSIQKVFDCKGYESGLDWKAWSYLPMRALGSWGLRWSFFRSSSAKPA